MSSKNDTGEIIKEFLELWQKQFSYITKDPEIISSMLKMFQQAQEGYLNTINKGYNAETNATADVSDDVDAELRQLRLRTQNLEKRVAQLESGAGISGKKTTGKNPRERSGSSAKGAAKPDKR